MLTLSTMPSRLSASSLTAVFSFLFVFMSLNAHADTALRVSPEVLKNTLSDYTILDARPESDYLAGHIEGALNFPEAFTYDNKMQSGRLVKPANIQMILRALGVNKNDPVIIYDSGTLVHSARLFWALEVYGLQNVRVLDHGYDDWMNKDYPISLDVPTVEASQYIPAINHTRLATKLTTQIAVRLNSQIVIDARPTPAYKGVSSSAKRFGHIPTALSIPASHNISHQSGMASLRPIAELRDIYADIPKNKKIVLYCAIGRISATNYLALRELGYNVANYDSSWKEWGNDFTLPIEK